MFYDVYTKLCDDLGESPSAVALKCGYSAAAASGWAKGAVPRKQALRKIAEYFKISLAAFDASANDIEYYKKLYELSDDINAGTNDNPAFIRTPPVNSTISKEQVKEYLLKAPKVEVLEFIRIAAEQAAKK